MVEERIIIAGFGGQGIMLLGKLLAHAGMQEQHNVTWLPSYGPEMRGGTANCHVIISDEEIGAPMVTEATCVMAMNLPSLDKFESHVIPGKRLLFNRSLIDRTIHRTDVEALAIPINDIANQQGSLRVANMVMLGAYLALSQIVQLATVFDAIKDVLGEGKQHLFDINAKALQAGMSFAAHSGG